MPIVLLPVGGIPLPVTTFSAVTPEASAFLPGCPSLVIERTVRKIAIDLCQRARVWVTDAVPLTLVAGTYEYGVASTQAETDVIDVKDAYLIQPDGTKTDVKWRTASAVHASLPEWPENAEGVPLYMMTPRPGYVALAPVPDDAGTVYLRVYTRPTATATGWPQWLNDEFGRTVFHGTLHELMAMPDRAWSNGKLAEYHGKQWTYLLSQATIRAGQEYNTDSQAVVMRPFA